MHGASNTEVMGSIPGKHMNW